MDTLVTVYPSDRSYIEEMASSADNDIMVICQRLFIQICEGDSKQKMAEDIVDRLQEDPMKLALLLPKVSLELLLALWENVGKSYDMVENIAGLSPLVFFGFVYVEDQIVYINDEAKNMFYFSLRSKAVKRLADRYDVWEQMMLGMTRIYGIVDVYYIHPIFSKVVGEDVDYGELETFFVQRSSLWHETILLRSSRDKRMFVALVTIPDRNYIFDQWNLHQDLMFKEYSRDVYARAMSPLGYTQWKGVDDLLFTVVEIMNDSKMEAAAHTEAMILSIQNGEDCRSILDKYIKMFSEKKALSQEIMERLENCVRIASENVPLYVLKGHARADYGIRREFQVIKGGKNE